jgi:hypothetical protein
VGRSCTNAEGVADGLAKTLVGRATKTGPAATWGQASTDKGGGWARRADLKVGRSCTNAEGVADGLAKTLAEWAPKTGPTAARGQALAEKRCGMPCEFGPKGAKGATRVIRGAKDWAVGSKAKSLGMPCGFGPKGAKGATRVIRGAKDWARGFKEPASRPSQGAKGDGWEKRGLLGAGKGEYEPKRCCFKLGRLLGPMPRDLCGEDPRITGHGRSQSGPAAATVAERSAKKVRSVLDSAAEWVRWSTRRMQAEWHEPLTW